ncbi:MAG TPA: carbonic anhydrase family protein [Chroococcidiopsis sp.]
MDRRTLLKGSLTSAILGSLGIVSPIAQSADAQAANAQAANAQAAKLSDRQSSWGYIGDESPQHWGELSSEYRACTAGAEQSPIDLHDPQKTVARGDRATLALDYHNTPLKILHNGHTVQVNYAPGSTLRLDDQDYELLQFHFHEPSEHTVDQRPYAMEMHLVHKNQQTGNLAVVGVLIKEGAQHPALDKIWQHMPRKATPETTVPQVSVNAAQLLPAQKAHYYRYHGSLTTPPCSEVVNWIVLAQPIEASSQQIAQFKTAVGDNARPTQPLHRRVLRLQ